MEVNQESIDKLRAVASAFAKAINEVWKRIVGFIRENWKWIKAKAIELYRLDEKKQSNKLQYRMNFTRIKIMHQVIDRRPKQMIRKIIH